MTTQVTVKFMALYFFAPNNYPKVYIRCQFLGYYFIFISFILLHKRLKGLAHGTDKSADIVVLV